MPLEILKGQPAVIIVTITIIITVIVTLNRLLHDASSLLLVEIQSSLCQANVVYSTLIYRSVVTVTRRTCSDLNAFQKYSC